MTEFDHISPTAWIVANKLINENQQPIEFSDHRFLIEPFDDMHPDIVVKKSAQVGFSVLAILKSFWLAKYRGLNTIYVLPTQDIVKGFVNPKVDPLIASNDCITKAVNKDSVTLKQVGDRFIHYKGSASQREAISTSADLLVIDEYDRCFEPDTEILTKNGWTKIQDVTMGTLVATKANTGGIVFKAPTRLIARHEPNQLLRFTAGQLDIAVTPNHLMYARTVGDAGYKLHEADQLIGKKFSMTSRVAVSRAPIKWDKMIYIPHIQIHRKLQGSSKRKAQIVYLKGKKYDAESFYSFLGWYISEGNICKPKGTSGRRRPNGVICISQKDETQVARIVGCVKGLGHIPKVYKSKTTDVYSVQFKDLLLAYKLHKLGYSHEKYIPKDWLWKANKKCLTLLLQSLIAGDGDERNVYTTNSQLLADDVQTIALRLGKTASIYYVDPPGYKRVYMVGIKDRIYKRFNKYRGSNTTGTVTAEPYNGNVYCIDLPPYHTLLVRGAKDNKKLPMWSGNCMDMTVLNTYDSRLQASKHAWRWRFSNPSAVGFGVDYLFQDSDQRHWFVKCSHCDHKWYIEFEKDELTKQHYVDQKRQVFACGKCGKELTDNDRRNGEWIARYPTRERHGYWFSQMMAPWVTAKRILEQKDESSIDFFYNFVLGKAYTPSDMVVNRETILRACAPSQIPRLNVTIGVDQNVSEQIWVAMTPQGVFAHGKAKSWEEIEHLKLMWNAVVVCDPNPYSTMPKQMARKYSNWYLCYFKQTDGMEIVQWKESIVYADRTRLLDLVATEIAEARLLFREAPYALEDYIKDWSNIYRTTVEKDDGKIKSEWLKKEGQLSDYSFATAYARIGLGRVIGGDSQFIEPDSLETPTPTDTITEDGRFHTTLNQAIEETFEEMGT